MTLREVTAESEEIPIVTDVKIISDVEANEIPPATNPDYVRETRESNVTITAPTDTNVPSRAPTQNTRSDARKKLHKNLGRRSCGLQCQHCNRETVTIVEDRIGMGTILATVLLAFLFWPLCWLPFCMPSCKRTQHYCGHDACKRKVGVTHVCA